jgi:hypothetical protein
MRKTLATALVLISAASLAALADDPAPAGKRARSSAKTTATAPVRGARSDRAAKDTEPPAADREQAALQFVRENHPELADLLELLKTMKPEQYQKAIAELWQTSRSLANLKKNDERRYAAALDVWKARSRTELLAAQLAGAPGAGRESQLKAALENQMAAELRQHRLDRELMQERMRKLDALIERLETKRDDLVESRLQTLMKKAERARRVDAGQVAPSATATEKGEN